MSGSVKESQVRKEYVDDPKSIEGVALGQKTSRNLRNPTQMSLLGPNSGRSLKKWTEEEDKKLLDLALATKGKCWKWVSQQFNDKSETLCRSRWERIKPGMKQGRWTAEEDNMLRLLHSAYGDRWAFIARILVSRTGKQVRDRIKNVLSETRKDFSPEQDEVVYKLYLKNGTRWTLIRDKFFPDYSVDFIKNQFYLNYKKFQNKFKNLEEKEHERVEENERECEIDYHSQEKTSEEKISEKHFQDDENNLNNKIEIEYEIENEEIFTEIEVIHNIEQELKLENEKVALNFNEFENGNINKNVNFEENDLNIKKSGISQINSSPPKNNTSQAYVFCKENILTLNPNINHTPSPTPTPTPNQPFFNEILNLFILKNKHEYQELNISFNSCLQVILNSYQDLQNLQTPTSGNFYAYYPLSNPTYPNFSNFTRNFINSSLSYNNNSQRYPTWGS
jgi:hypothetical protein